MAKKDPFDDDGDGDDKVADKAATKDLLDKISERKESEAITKSGDDLEIDVDKAEEELQDTGGPQRESRQERKRNRYREQQESRAAAEKRADDAERRERETRELMVQLQRQAAPQQAPAPPKESEYDAELDAAFAEQDMVYRDFNSRQNVTPEEHAEFVKKVRSLQRRILIAGNKVGNHEMGVGKAPTEQQIRATMTAQRLREEHGDVLGDERKRMYMDGHWRMLMASGRSDDWSTLSDAAEATRRKFGMPTKTRQAPPSDSYKRKLSGNARGAGGNGGSESRVVVMNKDFKRMADASYRHIKDPAERYKRWAAGPGAKMIDKG